MTTPHKQPERQLALSPFLRTWNLTCGPSATGLSLSLTFQVLQDRHAFRRFIGTHALVVIDGRVIAVRNIEPIDTRFKTPEHADTIHIGACSLDHSQTHGKLTSSKSHIEWDLHFIPRLTGLKHFPRLIHRFNLLRMNVHPLHSLIDIRGSIRVDGTTYDLDQLPGQLNLMEGKRHPHEWAWINATLRNTDGQRLTIEGLSIQPSSRLNMTFYSLAIHYDSRSYLFDSFSTPLAIKSKMQLSHWTFTAERGSLRFAVDIQNTHKDLAGITREDTDGDFAFTYLTSSSVIRVTVYQEDRFVSVYDTDTHGSLAYTSHTKNPYIPMVL